ncbi:unnamed protein product [Cuscuta campestris]|uniref:Polygalacturonase n=1 Tax=Cuscuta campestris TaxID=132261 RepID=A0A484M160_9ASTE|nr:unnamed protein product [Cuscuta campestris]
MVHIKVILLFLISSSTILCCSRSVAAAPFNVLTYGAKGDETTDDTQAFEKAWADACKAEGSTLLVPSGHKFLVGQISLVGPCKTNMIFQLDGQISAPSVTSKTWGAGGTLQWLEFKNLNGFTITGQGTIDGKGSGWWSSSSSKSSSNSLLMKDDDDHINYNNISFGGLKIPSTKPTALRFYGSQGVTVTGIQFINSPKAHLKFDSCTNVAVNKVKITSPETSPNTDGIHLQNTKGVTIQGSTIACGDDCISIQSGCSGVNINGVTCGPSHGISIGGLGKDKSKACVSNVTVTDSTIKTSLTAVRIKTWQGGSGSVSGVKFSNIQCQAVKTAIMIDQFYCDGNGNHCANQTSAVDVSDVSFQGIKGTYTVKPVQLACSESLGCTGITLGGINLTPAGTAASPPSCLDTYGQVTGATTPPINCLKTGKQPKKNAATC